MALRGFRPSPIANGSLAEVKGVCQEQATLKSERKVLKCCFVRMLRTRTVAPSYIWHTVSVQSSAASGIFASIFVEVGELWLHPNNELHLAKC
jgi:hypothetical protein